MFNLYFLLGCDGNQLGNPAVFLQVPAFHLNVPKLMIKYNFSTGFWMLGNHQKEQCLSLFDLENQQLYS